MYNSLRCHLIAVAFASLSTALIAVGPSHVDITAAPELTFAPFSVNFVIASVDRIVIRGSVVP